MRPLLYWFSKRSLQWSTKLFPVSDALVSADYTYMDTTYKKQGFKNFYKNVSTPYEVIYNGVDIDRFRITNQERNPRSFVTVAAGINSQGRRSIKGIDLVIELARITPENQYTIIGSSGSLDIDLPSNITVIDFVPHEALVDHYNRHAFYLQLSTSEGFVIAVCEAMLCGCVPIVSKVGASPFIAGGTGYVLERKDVNMLQQLIEKAVAQYSPADKFPPQDYIATHFSLQMRKQKLLKALEGI
jgi:glycosyltransferase involved in cell wall biosynthesis